MTSQRVSTIECDSLPASCKPVDRICYVTCPGSNLRIVQMKRNDAAEMDSCGVFLDSWWCIQAGDLPTRYFRIFRGGSSLWQLLSRYAFLDANECVNHKTFDVTYLEAPASEFVNKEIQVPHDVRDYIGVPQFHVNSGVCWYAAFCWVAFGCSPVREVVTSRLSEGMTRDALMALMQPDAAKRLRSRLWHDFSLGDDVNGRPEDDGQNGGSEFALLCSKSELSLACLCEDGGKFRVCDEPIFDHGGKRCSATCKRGDHPTFVMLRFVDGDHSGRFGFRRRIVYNTKVYKLFAFFMGQLKCGHQIGMVSPTGNWRDWGVVDADAHKHGIGPMFFRVDEASHCDWWKKIHLMINVTKYGENLAEFCPLSPWNTRDDVFDSYRSASSPTRRRYRLGRNDSHDGVGHCSVDAVYIRSDLM